mmetsp:Transcript_38489/g.63088  ORF Transcript_38489/g.63088 Transcript_38489/m.63088 type:complete len:289 (-) Transcript_38489:352-1218(-)
MYFEAFSIVCLWKFCFTTTIFVFLLVQIKQQCNISLLGSSICTKIVMRSIFVANFIIYDLQILDDIVLLTWHQQRLGDVDNIGCSPIDCIQNVVVLSAEPCVARSARIGFHPAILSGARTFHCGRRQCPNEFTLCIAQSVFDDKRTRFQRDHFQLHRHLFIFYCGCVTAFHLVFVRLRSRVACIGNTRPVRCLALHHMLLSDMVRMPHVMNGWIAWIVCQPWIAMLFVIIIDKFFLFHQCDIMRIILFSWLRRQNVLIDAFDNMNAEEFSFLSCFAIHECEIKLVTFV